MAIADTLARFVFPVRITQIVSALVVLITSGYVINTGYNDYGFQGPSQFNFLLFTSIWTILVVTFLMVAIARIERLAHPYITMAVEALTMLFWFAAFIAAAVLISGPVSCVSGFCHAARAAVVFGAFEWILFAYTTLLAVLAALHGRHAGPTPNNATAA